VPRTLKDVIDPVLYEMEELLETKYGFLTKLFVSGVITYRHRMAVKVIVPNVLFQERYRFCVLMYCRCLFLFRTIGDFNKR